MLLMRYEQNPHSAFIDRSQLRAVMGHFATGVTVITTCTDESVHGMTANAFMSVSMDPPLVLVSVGHRSRMHELLQKTGSYGVSVLSQEQKALSRHFAGKQIDALEIPFAFVDEVPVIDGALAKITAQVVDAHPAGDHTLFIAEVTHVDRREGHPLVFHSGGYQELAERYSDPTFSDSWSDFCVDRVGPVVQP